jgi:site-specific DNA recombinase
VNDGGGSSAGRAILYARVSTRGQVSDGYSLAQQMEALRQHAARMGYEILEEVLDAGQSATSLRRPGLDRVRDLVVAGGVSVVILQDLDRLAREPEHHYLLWREFEQHGCTLVTLDDHDPSDAQLAKHEQIKLTERTQRGKLRKAREGKILAGGSPNFGFRFNAARDGYEVDEDSMMVVRRIFHMIGVEKLSLNAVKRTLEAEKIPSPSGNKHWSTCVIRRFVLDDVYRPHAFEEVAKLVTPEVAAGLDPSRQYGVWWFNRERWSSKRIAEVSEEGRTYRQSIRIFPKPQEEWVAVPVPNSGLRREVVQAARDTLLNNKPCSNSSERFWELSGGILRCAECGRRMRTCVTRKKSGKRYFYYACAKRREGWGVCPNYRSHRADALEAAVLRVVSESLANPEKVHRGFEARIERERCSLPGDPSATENALLGRLAEAERTRRGYLEITAKGLMTFEELAERLEELKGSREATLRELEELQCHREGVKRLEADRDLLLELYAGSQPASLEGLEPRERHRVYRMLQLEVLVSEGGNLSVSSIVRGAVLSVAKET